MPFFSPRDVSTALGPMVAVEVMTRISSVYWRPAWPDQERPRVPLVSVMETMLMAEMRNRSGGESILAERCYVGTVAVRRDGGEVVANVLEELGLLVRIRRDLPLEIEITELAMRDDRVGFLAALLRCLGELEVAFGHRRGLAGIEATGGDRR